MSDLRTFLREHTARIEPLSRDLHLAYWDATLSGRKEDFDRFAAIEIEFQKVYTDRAAFERVRGWRENGDGGDVDRRQIDLLYHAYLRNQVDPELIESLTRLSTQIINRFNVYRAEVDGRVMTSNEVRNVLKQSTDSEERRRVWESDKDVGNTIAGDLVELVRLRNRVAHTLGFDNYYAMSLELAEQDETSLFETLDRLEALTREPFRAMKEEVDARLAATYGITPSRLQPWHYHDPFFQEAPAVFDLDLDAFYRGRDIVALVRDFYAGIGLDAVPILERSDLYEKEGKEQHAYCMDIDRRGDIRVLANIHDDENWTGTMLHELGHGVYDLYIDPTLPFLLREHAHIFATEAIAMLFGRLSKDPQWIQFVTGIADDERDRISATLDRKQKLGQLVFARWCQVMTRFERALYRDPEQDLTDVWWSLVERYQMVSRPDGRDAADWAAKIHVVSAPVYYHNYMLGELLASQLDHVIQRDVLGADGERVAMNGRVDVGAYLRESVFAPGKRYHWDEMIRRATGEALNPEHFVAQFVS